LHLIDYIFRFSVRFIEEVDRDNLPAFYVLLAMTNHLEVVR